MQRHKASQQYRDDTVVSLPEWNAGYNGIAKMYRVMLFSDGEEVFVDQRESGETKQVRKGFKREQVKRVLAKGGKLTLGETLRSKVRHFSDGMTFGSK